MDLGAHGCSLCILFVVHLLFLLSNVRHGFVHESICFGSAWTVMEM
jgi:hypothetical protein